MINVEIIFVLDSPLQLYHSPLIVLPNLQHHTLLAHVTPTPIPQTYISDSSTTSPPEFVPPPLVESTVTCSPC